MGQAVDILVFAGLNAQRRRSGWRSGSDHVFCEIVQKLNRRIKSYHRSAPEAALPPALTPAAILRQLSRSRMLDKKKGPGLICAALWAVSSVG